MPLRKPYLITGLASIVETKADRHGLATFLMKNRATVVARLSGRHMRMAGYFAVARSIQADFS
jgi:hypothetical protein